VAGGEPVHGPQVAGIASARRFIPLQLLAGFSSLAGNGVGSREAIMTNKGAFLGSMILGASVLLPAPVAAQTASDLRALIEAQAELLAAQARQLEEQTRQLEAMRQRLDHLEAAEGTAEVAQVPFEGEPTEPPPAFEVVAPETPPAQTMPERVITSGQPEIEVAISGHINRMINVADDGDSTKTYFVDNGNSVSRVRLVGTGRIDETLSIGTAIELGIAPNPSFRVSQDNEDAGDFTDQRIVQAYVDSTRFGRLALGKGPMASDGAGLQDISGTSVIQYSAIADTAGGLQFVSDGDLTGISISDVFSNLNGSRRDRIRYDTPSLAGFSLATSFASNQRYDGAVYWAGRNDTWEATAAAAVQQPNIDDVDVRLVSSGSMLHRPTGLNATFNAGRDIRDGRDYSTLYGKLGVITELVSLGPTAFSVDYDWADDRPINSAAAITADGSSAGFAVVQDWTRFGAELYFGLRWHKAELRGGDDVDDILVSSFGTRVRF